MPPIRGGDECERDGRVRVLSSRSGSKWFEVKVSPADDRTLAIFFRDITERKLGQMALAQSEERLRLAQQGARAGLWDWDMVGRRRHLVRRILRNQRARSGHAAFAWNISGRTCIAKIETASSNAFNEALAERRPDRHSVSHRASAAGAALDRRARATPTYADDGSPLRTSGIVLDITERKRAEESLGFLSEAGNVLSGAGRLRKHGAKRGPAGRAVRRRLLRCRHGHSAGHDRARGPRPSRRGPGAAAEAGPRSCIRSTGIRARPVVNVLQTRDAGGGDRGDA